jgi:acetate kinase
MLKMPEVDPFLRSHTELFANLPKERLEALLVAASLRTFEPNEAVVELGEQGRFVGVLLDGEAEVSFSDDAGGRHHVARLCPGDVFGEMSLLTGDRTSADVVGVTRCQAVLFPQGKFSELCLTHPPAVQVLARLLRARSIAFAENAGPHGPDPYGLSLRAEAPIKLLVVNCGSSSLKYNLFDTADEKRNAKGLVERIGAEGTRHRAAYPAGEIVRELPRAGFAEAFAAVLSELTDESTGVLSSPDEIAAVGHRVVHGGEHFSSSALVNDDVVAKIDSVSSLAPLHNPVNLVGIREARRAFPNAHHVAVFDTAFHHTLPAYARVYGLPYDYYENKGIRRYGFHGTSHRYAGLRAAQLIGRPYGSLEIVSCHLGNGASCCAVDHGRSVDTSMGLTPAEGLIMGTRCGDIDPAAIVHLMRTEGLTIDQIDELLNKKGGLRGLSGLSNDMREIEAAAENGDPRALLAFEAFSYRVRKYIGAYAAAMGGIDVVAFTGGIGQGSARARSLICQGLEWMGIEVDEERNKSARGFDEVCLISKGEAKVAVVVVPADEERMIAHETLRTLSREQIATVLRARRQDRVPLEVSAHHVHLSREHVALLFGEGHELTPETELSQPGQYACKEKVDLVGPRGRIDRVRVLGPARKATQVEIAMTEQFKLGIASPVRESGDVAGSPGLLLVGPAGKVDLGEGVICAMRHIHMSPEDALRFGLRDKSVVEVRVEGGRELVFGDVLVRVSPSFRLAMHIDTDEANAAGIATGTVGHVVGIESQDGSG